MEDDEGGGSRLNKKPLDKSGEVDYRTKAGTAWSHNFLNQKPWHPLSYPNQRRKWIAEQTHAEKERRAEEVAREVCCTIFVIISVSSLQFVFTRCCFVGSWVCAMWIGVFESGIIQLFRMRERWMICSVLLRKYFPRDGLFCFFMFCKFIGLVSCSDGSFLFVCLQ